MCKSKQLQKRIEDNLKAMAEICPSHGGAEGKIARLHSEIFVAASQLAEISTRRIVLLTVALLILTAALLVYTVFLYKDAHADIQHRALTEHHELQVPKAPESKPR